MDNFFDEEGNSFRSCDTPRQVSDTHSGFSYKNFEHR